MIPAPGGQCLRFFQPVPTLRLYYRSGVLRSVSKVVKQLSKVEDRFIGDL